MAQRDIGGVHVEGHERASSDSLVSSSINF